MRDVAFRGNRVREGDSRRERSRVRELIGVIREDEGGIVRETLTLLEPYRPDTGPLSMTAYFTAAGVSDGFVFDDRAEPAFYANLARAGGDPEAVVGNLAHESYHVMRKAAQRRAGLHAVADGAESRAESHRGFGPRLIFAVRADGPRLVPNP